MIRAPIRVELSAIMFVLERQNDQFNHIWFVTNGQIASMGIEAKRRRVDETKIQRASGVRLRKKTSHYDDVSRLLLIVEAKNVGCWRVNDQNDERSFHSSNQQHGYSINGYNSCKGVHYWKKGPPKMKIQFYEWLIAQSIDKWASYVV